MTLTEYIKSYPRRDRVAVRKRIADVLGISEVYVRSMCNRNKPLLAKYAIRIEQLTHGAVPRYITAPDYFQMETQK